ncbi:MAG: hypothetical protein KDJ38_03380 [Gammaproteobacteria bacterium]|nr:hypothetical protein [Gammaproteobacteria bacterium]
MANITLEEWVPLLAREGINRRGTLVAIFALTALLLLTAGYFWQKKYLSTVTLYIDESNIVRPLLEGAAVSADTKDKAYIAAEILFSQEIMEKILTEGGWVNDSMSLPERERIKEKVIEKTTIENINSTLLRIAFENSDPQIAYETTKRYAELFLDKTMRSQSEESNEAFEFIVTQVETYRKKLSDSEKRLQDFRSKTTDARPGTEDNLDERILELRRKIEQTELEYAEADSRARSLHNELQKVALTADNVYRESQYLEQIRELQADMDLLLLTYTEDYPDVVKLRQQIEDLNQLAEREKVKRIEETQKAHSVVIGKETFITSNTSINPIYQQLSGEASRAQAYADSLRSRIQQTRALLEKELSRSSKTTEVERELAELTRDYQVNQDIYQDLLRRRESARVSMTLDKERQGVLYRIQEPASFPILPGGVRFLHFAAAGLVLGLLFPLLYLIGFLQVDPRIRLASTVTDGLELPLLAVVPHMRLPGEKTKWYLRKGSLVLVVIVVLLLYAGVSWLKFIQGF